MSVAATRDDVLVLVENDGMYTTYPPEALGEVNQILTTPAQEKVSELTATGIRDGLRTLQPGDPGHAAASLESAGFAVTVLP